MSLLALIFTASVAAIIGALLVPSLSDLLLLAGPCAVASLILLINAFVAGQAHSGDAKPRDGRQRTSRPKKKAGRAPLVIDGSNIMYWRDNTPRLDTVLAVIAHTKAQGFAPGIMFDANAGYLLTGRYLDDPDFARLLGLPADNVVVVHKGTQADGVILAAARDIGASVVTNDRYRDWAETFPEVGKPGFLVGGGYGKGGVWLDFPVPAEVP